MQKSSHQKTRVPDVKCHYDILYTVDPTPCDKKMFLRTPDPLSAFQEGLGTRLSHNYRFWGDVIYLTFD